MSLPESERGGEAAGGPAVNVLTRLHFIWFIVWAFVITIPLATLQVVSHLFRPTAKNFKIWSGMWGRAVLAFGGMRVRVVEEVPLDPDQPYIFISNHQNLLDILALSGHLPYPFGFVAKKELAKVPFLGLAIRNSASVFLDRSDPRKAIESLQKAGQRIRRGTSVLLFPEGTRSYGPFLQPLKKGAFMLAVEAQVPIVPVVMVDGYRLMHEKRKTSRPGGITIRLLPPIDIAGMSRRDIPQLIGTLEETMDRPLRQHRADLVSSADSSHI